MTLVRVSGISKSFQQPEYGQRLVLNAIDMELTSSRFVAMIGPNGSGKTTLLNIIAGLIEPDKGSIEISGVEGERLKVGYVWQNYRDALLPWFAIEDNIALPLRAAGKTWDAGRERARDLLAEFLPDVAPHARPYELSGGQQQLVSLLRAVVADPDILLLDEPFSSLDQHRSWDTALYVERIWSQRRVPVLFVSHDVDEAVLLADNILLLSKTRFGLVGNVENPLPRPRTLDMLTDTQHLKCRNEVIGFLRSDDGAAGVE